MSSLMELGISIYHKYLETEFEIDEDLDPVWEIRAALEVVATLCPADDPLRKLVDTELLAEVRKYVPKGLGEKEKDARMDTDFAQWIGRLILSRVALMKISHQPEIISHTLRIKFNEAEIKNLRDDKVLLRKFIDTQKAAMLNANAKFEVEAKNMLQEILEENLNIAQTDEDQEFDTAAQDNHVHAAAMMTRKELLTKARQMARTNPHFLQVLKLENIEDITEYNMGIIKTDDTMYNNFSEFMNRFSVFGSSDARDALMKTGSEAFGNLVRTAILRLQRSNIYPKVRFSIAQDGEGGVASFFNWLVDCRLDNLEYDLFVQFNRTKLNAKERIKTFFDVICKISTWEEQNAKPVILVDTEFKDCDYRKIKCAFDRLCGIDLVGDESQHPAEDLYEFMFDQLVTFNSISKKKLVLAPHAGEFASGNQVSLSYLFGGEILHGVKMPSKATELLCLLHQIKLNQTIISNNMLAMKAKDHSLKRSLGLGQHCTFGSDDPLIFHGTENPLREEFDFIEKNFILTQNEKAQLLRSVRSDKAYFSSETYKNQENNRLVCLKQRMKVLINLRDVGV